MRNNTRTTFLAATVLLMFCAAAAVRADILYVRDMGPEKHIFRTAGDGGDETQLTSNNDETLKRVYNLYPSISADNRRISYASYRIYEDEGLRLWREWNGQQFYPREEFYIYFYSYFPSRTYYTRHKSLNWNIFSMNLDSGEETKISNFLWQELQPQFMPRGSDMLYMLKAQKSYFLLKGGRSGKNFKQITLSDNQALDPQISPDGRSLAYHSYRHWNYDLYTMRMANLPRDREETRLTKTSHVNEVHPRWSPDGNSVIYLANLPGDMPGSSFYDLCIYYMDTEISTCLTDGEHVNPDMVFSPDGEKIAYTSSRGGSRVLYTINRDGSGRKRITSSSETAIYPAWSPDSGSLAYLRKRGAGNWTLYTAGATGRNKKRASQQKAFPSTIVWF